MNHKTIKGLISAYADGELNDEQRRLVDNHLEECPDCRAALAEQTDIRTRLLSLGKIPDVMSHSHQDHMPDGQSIKERIMDEIESMIPSGGMKRRFRPALVAVPIIAGVITVLSLQVSGFFFNPSGIIAKAYSATEELESYRVLDNAYTRLVTTDDGPVQTWHLEFEYAGPDSYHMKKQSIESVDTPSYFHELVVYGDLLYTKGDPSRLANPEEVVANIPSKEKTLEDLDILTDIEILDDEYIDDILCFHYRGKADMEKYIEKTHSQRVELFSNSILGETQDSLTQAVETAEESWRQRERVYEYWIGKEDYLVRQKKIVVSPQVYPFKSDIEMTEIVRYYDFNKEVIIKPPLDETGNLLAGWVQTTLTK